MVNDLTEVVGMIGHPKSVANKEFTIIGEDMEVLALDYFKDKPRRKMGRTILHTVEDFADFIKAHKTPASVVFYQEEVKTGSKLSRWWNNLMGQPELKTWFYCCVFDFHTKTEPGFCAFKAGLSSTAPPSNVKEHLGDMPFYYGKHTNDFDFRVRIHNNNNQA